MQHLCKHLTGLLQYVVIPKSQDTKALLLQPLRAGVVIGQRLRLTVLSAIQLNHQLLLQANEIQHIGTEWMLPAELAAC